MAPDEQMPPKYHLMTVERAALEMAAELHPRSVAPDELCRRLVGSPADRREVQTAERAIQNLREFGVLREREGGVLALAPAVLRTAALLTQRVPPPSR